MPWFDRYEKVRPPLNVFDQQSIENDEKKFRERIEAAQAKHPDWDPAANKVAGGYIGPDGFLIENWALVTAIEIAKTQAEEQLTKLDEPMPEDEEITLRFPGTSPKGKYSIIDMKLAQRRNDINANAHFCSPELNQYINDLLSSPLYQDLQNKVADVSARHRILTRASKLCIYEDGRQWLHEQARKLETDPDVIKMDQLMQGIEYLCGMRDSVTPDVTNLFQNELKLPLSQQQRQQLNPEPKVPDTLEIQFENFNDILIQRTFSDPYNWGKHADDLDITERAATKAANAVQPYAIATAKQALKPAIAHMERGGYDFRDLLIVDGKSIQEHMDEKGITDKAAAENWASALVSSALMSGKRVEAFIPDKNGKLPAEPMSITNKGYVPERSEPLVLNTWERFCAKLGFYKEKVAQIEAQAQAEHKERERIQAARERVKPNIEKRANQAAAQKIRSDPANIQNMFFGGKAAELAAIPNIVNGITSPFKNTSRSSPASVCICALAINHPLEDILDPNKLQAEKQAVTQRYLDEARSGGFNWLGEVTAAGTIALERQMNEIAQRTDYTDPIQRANALPVLYAASCAGYDIFQDVMSNELMLQVYSETRLELEFDMARAQNKEYKYPEDRIGYGTACLTQLRQAHACFSTLADACCAKADLLEPNLSEARAQKALADMVIGDLALKAVENGRPVSEYPFNVEVQAVFNIHLRQQKEIGQVAKAIAEDPNARTAMANLTAAKPMNEVLKVTVPHAFIYPDAYNADNAAANIENNTKVTLTEHLTPVLGKNPVQAQMRKR